MCKGTEEETAYRRKFLELGRISQKEFEKPKWTEQEIAKRRKQLERGIISQAEFDGTDNGQGLLPFTTDTLTFEQMLQRLDYAEPDITLQEFQSRLIDDDWSLRYYIFFSRIQEGDEIRSWFFGASFSGRGGYILVRNGQAIACVTTSYY